MRPQGKIIDIVGTRRRDTASAFKEIKRVFDLKYEDGDIICSGGCKKGADRYAEQLTKTGIPILIYYPNYSKYGSPRALFKRNTQIAMKADILIACVMHPHQGIDIVLQRKKGGTEDTIKKFVKFKGTTAGIYLV